jgi:hypothetical protein
MRHVHVRCQGDAFTEPVPSTGSMFRLLEPSNGRLSLFHSSVALGHHVIILYGKCQEQSCRKKQRQPQSKASS